MFPAPTAADLRRFAHLPGEVPEALLIEHINVAMREAAKGAGLAGDVGSGGGADDDLRAPIWREAVIVRALASVFPWLNTFALDGIAKVGRLEGSIEYRFLDSDDTQARIDGLMARYRALLAQLAPVDDAPSSGAFALTAV